MIKDIIKLTGKKVVFPIQVENNKKTVEYFLGNSNLNIEKCVNFLNK